MSGAIYQLLLLSLSKIFMSRFCATMNAVAEPIAILIEIMSLKFVEIKSVKIIPIKKPTRTTCRAFHLPKALLDKSVIKKVIG